MSGDDDAVSMALIMTMTRRRNDSRHPFRQVAVLAMRSVMVLAVMSRLCVHHGRNPGGPVMRVGGSWTKGSDLGRLAQGLRRGVGKGLESRVVR